MHEKVLTSTAQKLVPKLAQFKEFYLVGGTALALQIGHRVSVDFDMFTDGALPDQLYQKIKRVFKDSQIIPGYTTANDQIHVLIDGVKVTFFAYPYPVVGLLLPYRGISLASTDEIAAMKALAIGRRLAFKDYVDWYFMLEGNHSTLEHSIALAKKKFGLDFNDRLFLGQLVSCADVPLQKIDFLGKPVSQKIIERYLAKVVRDYYRESNT